MINIDQTIKTGDRVRHIDGDCEMLVVERYLDPDGINGERAVTRWLSNEGTVQEYNFALCNVVRFQVTMGRFPDLNIYDSDGMTVSGQRTLEEYRAGF